MAETEFLAKCTHEGDGGAAEEVEEDDGEDRVTQTHVVVQVPEVSDTKGADDTVDREPEGTVCPPLGVMPFVLGHALDSARLDERELAVS